MAKSNIRTNKITPDFRWNEAAQRYIGPGSTGFVKNTTVREAIDKYIDKKGVEAQELAEALRDNLISIEEFQESLRELITDVHLANAAAAKGGWAQLTQSDYGKVGQMVKQELAGLKKWGKDGKKGGGFRKLLDDIESGKIPLDGRFVNRVKMYAQAGRHTYESMRRDEMAEAGMTEARSIRHASDSCNGCLNQALAGWMSLDDLILPGERDCVRNCKCTVEYRNGNETEFRHATPREFVKARNKAKRRTYLSDTSAKDLKDHRLFLSEDGKTGYAIDKNGDLQNVFNVGKKGYGGKAVEDAVKRGAKKLDCFDGFLSKEFYPKHGFVEVGRMSFDRQFAPKGWDYEKHGEPDIIFMERKKK